MRFDYDQLPGTVVFGRGAAQAELAAQFDALGLQNVMLVAGGSTLAEARRLTSEVDDRIGSVFTNVLPHVPTAVAEEARAQALATGADGLLSVGGGSTTGTAKIVALTSHLPIIAIPTTYAGSEMTPVWGLTTDARKETGIDRAVLPRTVIYDSTLTRTLPLDLAIASGFNALAHCVEAFWGPGENPVTSLHAGAGIRALAEGMRGVHGGAPTDDDYDQLLYGAYLAGSSFAVAGSGLHHKICHALGGAFNLPHAQTHAVMLPHVLAFNAGSIGADADAIAAALGAPKAAEGLWSLGRELDSPDNLEALGLKASQLDEAIAIVSAKLPIANPRPVTPDDIAAILTAAFSPAAGR
ncbi:maleylacetate reductase [Subtercola sp. PAMC28395]|uniref:maleylacetate reductase n=1 Tax=Subtercola sp. PAMC28395 TaxID=2846775 RepID=UPI001C0B778E|nr:maleylacetate reductase [Subtercola sp. PAMC28395]QWT25168.1 maleylacetate reductase [Subtercola sp. PAMC28395]